MGKVTKGGPGARAMLARVQGLEGVSGKVGYFETAKYPDGTPVAYVASIHEFGYAEGNIPPRPTMRPTIARESKTWALGFGKSATAIAQGTMTAPQAMEAVSMVAAGDVRKTISELRAPPIKEATIAARQRRYADKATRGNLAKPLVDTAVMVGAVTHLTEKTK